MAIRISWLAAAWLIVSAAGLPARVTADDVAETSGNIQWHDVASLPLEGQGWADTASRFDRFPARAETLVGPEVWALSQNSAGLSLRFRTDARRIDVRWTLRSRRIALPHMAATGVSGLDLYLRAEDRWQFLSVARPTTFPSNQVVLAQGLATGMKEFRLYLPLYNGVEKIEIGVQPESRFRQAAPAADAKPLVFYGTSITQGGCTSRPGMSYPAILGRRFERPTINLGFSGNGKCEPEVARLLAELDPAVYILDPLPNLETAQAEARLPGFIAILRSARPDTPIVSVENLIYPNAPFVSQREAKWRTSNEFLREHVAQLQAAGDHRLFLIRAEQLIGADGEGTVDALHPTDLGFLRMADAMEPILREALASDAGPTGQR